jgi:hypothetical protein
MLLPLLHQPVITMLLLHHCRNNFLKAGTMAKGAAESGAVESYMCNKIKRNPLVASSCAAYLGEFEAEEGANGIQKDTQWLVRYNTPCDCYSGTLNTCCFLQGVNLSAACWNA